jgi:TonB family protein
MHFYPAHESVAGVEGRSVMRCDVTVYGLLTACVVVSESPPDAGFGKASLHLANRFRMKPCAPGGLHVTGARVVIPIHWVLSGDQPPPATGDPGQSAALAWNGESETV